MEKLSVGSREYKGMLNIRNQIRQGRKPTHILCLELSCSTSLSKDIHNEIKKRLSNVLYIETVEWANTLAELRVLWELADSDDVTQFYIAEDVHYRDETVFDHAKKVITKITNEIKCEYPGQWEIEIFITKPLISTRPIYSRPIYSHEFAATSKKAKLK